MEKLPKKNNMYIFLYFLKIDDRCLIPRRILSESGTLFYSEYGAAFIMVIRVVEFSSGGTKLETLLPKNQHRKVLNFENWCNGEVSKSAQI